MTDVKQHPVDDDWTSELARLAARRLDATDQVERDRAGAAILALLAGQHGAPPSPAPRGGRPARGRGSAGGADRVPHPRLP